MKKIISILLILSLTLGTFIIPSLALDEEDLAVAAIESLGSLENDVTLYQNSELSRGAFCALAVLATGNADMLSTAGYYSPFSDVSSSYWANRSINLIYSNGWLSGYGDGTFNPDKTITLGEAVTAVLRMLGYTSADIGYSWPNDYIITANTMDLLDGVGSDAYETLTYGEAALLLTRMMGQETADGDDFISDVRNSAVTDIVITDVDTTNNIVTILKSGDEYYYTLGCDMSTELEYSARGSLLINKSGKAVGFIPNDESRVEVSISSVSATNINSAVSIPSSATLILGSVQTTFGLSYYDLERYPAAILCYGDLGTVELIIAQTDASTADYEMTGYLEAAYPNITQPETITIMGATLEVNDLADISFSGIDLGDKVTVTLNANGEVITATSGGSSTMIGVLGDDEITLTSGIVVSGDVTSSAETGELVKISSTDIGEISAYSISTSGSGDFDVVNMTLGGTAISSSVMIYETIDDELTERIYSSDIIVDTISSSDIKYYHKDSSGKVDIILLNDVTGNLYTYGRVELEEYTEKGLGDLTTTNDLVSIKNSSGSTKGVIYGTLSNYEDEACAIAIGADGEAVTGFKLTSTGEVGRSAFTGTEYLTVGSKVYPISDDVEVYYNPTGTWVSLETAKGLSDEFEAFYDKSIDEGGQIRVIYVY